MHAFDWKFRFEKKKKIVLRTNAEFLFMSSESVSIVLAVGEISSRCHSFMRSIVELSLVS